MSLDCWLVIYYYVYTPCKHVYLLYDSNCVYYICLPEYTTVCLELRFHKLSEQSSAKLKLTQSVECTVRGGGGGGGKHTMMYISLTHSTVSLA